MKPLLLSLALCSCTTVYKDGRKSAVIGSNIGHFALHDGAYSVEMDRVDNGIIIQKSGAAVSQGLMSAAGTALTGGIVK